MCDRDEHRLKRNLVPGLTARGYVEDAVSIAVANHAIR
jgi:hypothetical protein